MVAESENEMRGRKKKGTRGREAGERMRKLEGEKRKGMRQKDESVREMIGIERGIGKANRGHSCI